RWDVERQALPLPLDERAERTRHHRVGIGVRESVGPMMRLVGVVVRIHVRAAGKMDQCREDQGSATRRAGGARHAAAGVAFFAVSGLKPGLASVPLRARLPRWASSSLPAITSVIGLPALLVPLSSMPSSLHGSAASIDSPSSRPISVTPRP